MAQTVTVSGYVVDQKTGETLIGVNVLVKGLYKGAATDGNGYFWISGLSPGRYTLVVTHIGYEKKEKNVTLLTRSIVLDDIPLKPQPVALKDIVVKGQRSDVADVEMESGHREMTPRAIQSIPTSRGDVFRAIKFLPGIESVDPISPLYSVRGGDPGENLILLDGVTVYNPYHCVTSEGFFNLYAIKNVDMMVGGFGAEYGGRNASVLYITTREGNKDGLHGEIEPGLSQSKMVLDFPIGKSATMMISGRAYYDFVTQFLFYSPNYFYDMNISLNWKINRKNRLSLRYFFSRDDMLLDFDKFYAYFTSSMDTDVFEDYDLLYKNKWNNQVLTAILKTIVSPSIYLKTQISGSFFSAHNQSNLDFEYTDEETDETYKLFYHTDIKNKIRDLSGKLTLTAKLNATNTLTLGAEYNRYEFTNDILINYFSEGEITRQPSLFAGFIEEKFQAKWFILRGGMRISKYSNMGKWYPEPRFSMVIPLPWDMKLHGAWGQYYQYIISINSQDYEISQFLDYYYPLTNQDPSASTHTIIGIDKAVSDFSRLSLGFYYKDISRVYTFDYNISETEAYRFSDKIQPGSGKAYGVELLWQGTWNKLAGWISYGFCKSTRTYPHIMNGKTYLFDYDRTHTLKAMITHQVHSSLSYSGTLRILTGVPKSIETGVNSYYYYDPVTNNLASYPIYTTPSKNNARLPLYVRLDLGLKKRLRKGFGADLANFLGADESYLNLTFGNLLFFHRNVMFYLPVGEEKLYGLGTNYIPEFSMSYTIKF